MPRWSLIDFLDCCNVIFCCREKKQPQEKSIKTRKITLDSLQKMTENPKKKEHCFETTKIEWRLAAIAQKSQKLLSKRHISRLCFIFDATLTRCDDLFFQTKTMSLLQRSFVFCLMHISMSQCHATFGWFGVDIIFKSKVDVKTTRIHNYSFHSHIL